jgi:outer membrane lipoprotein carrier protein
MLKIITILFLMLMPALAAPADSLLKCSAKYFEPKPEFKFDFKMHTRLSTGEEFQKNGTLVTGGKDRFTLSMPDLQVFSDGTNLWQHNPLQKQVLIKLLSDLENKLYPSEVLFKYLGTTALSVKTELWKGKSVHALTLNPSKYKDQFKAMEVWLSPKDCSPLRLHTVDNLGNSTWYSIENLSKGSFPASTFKFKAPPGTDEIDMR